METCLIHQIFYSHMFLLVLAILMEIFCRRCYGICRALDGGGKSIQLHKPKRQGQR
uniref:Uncharacterized protein n=1 Tax=Rhizophora mucronata TaxID=61149 RepID=A0A2P2P0M0_RHIMU